jgi:hypothetical protein
MASKPAVVEEKTATRLLEGAPWILVAGVKGAGKTRLVATGPEPYCLDTEPPGSASAYPPERRKAFTSDVHIYEKVHAEIQALMKAKKVERGIEYNGLRIGCLVIDTFDTLQKFLIARFLQSKRKPNWVKPDQIWAPAVEQRDWGTLLNYQAPLIADLKTLPIPVMFVAHSKISEPLYKGYGDEPSLIKQGYIGLAIQGSIEDWIVNLCDYILHIVIQEDGKRKVYTQPTVFQDARILAADRHNLFRNEGQNITSFELTVDANGVPTRKVLQYICDHHSY